MGSMNYNILSRWLESCEDSPAHLLFWALMIFPDRLLLDLLEPLRTSFSLAFCCFSSSSALQPWKCACSSTLILSFWPFSGCSNPIPLGWSLERNFWRRCAGSSSVLPLHVTSMIFFSNSFFYCTQSYIEIALLKS